MVSARSLAVLQRALTLAQGLLVLGVVLLAAVFIRHRSAPPTALVAAPPVQAGAVLAAAAEPVHALEWYAPLWQRDVSQPPIPPAPPPPEAPRPAAPPAPLPTLLGTFVEPGARWAQFAAGEGPPRLVPAGGVIDGCTVVEIVPGRVQLRRGAELIWVEVTKSPAPPRKNR